MNECPSCRTTHRNEETKKKLITRINRIKGQIEGIKKMVEEEMDETGIFNNL